MNAVTRFSDRFRRCGSAMLTALLAVATSLPAAAADYRLGAGDIIEIAIAGLPDFRYKLPIDLEGNAAVPYAGPIAVAGKSIGEVRALVQEQLPAKLVRQRTLDGRDVPVVVLPEEVVVSVSEYRPVYINGDVAHPGEQPFRPGMTVRKALALSGGFDIMRFRATNPFLDSADLRAEYDGLISAAAKDQLQIWRLQILLGQRNAFDLKSLPQTGAVVQLAANEKDQLATMQSDYDKEKSYLRDAVKKAGEQLTTLQEQRGSEDEGTKADTDDYGRLRDLYQKGTVAMLRLSDARRNVLLSSTRWLQTTAQVVQLARERDELGRKVVRFDEQRRSDLLKELQDATVRLDTTRARIDAVAEKMLYTGMVKSQLVRGKSGKPQIKIFRKDDPENAPTVADEDTELLPGDTVEVALTTEYALSIGSR